ncbi:amino acid permease-domain-containing protein [Russula aff. rugulosa BPL654]|nr:amino acid permease-domain-containing protein [Russula aff. rugulosa BPL654]
MSASPNTSYGTITPTRSRPRSPTGTSGLHRGLSSRQVQMIAIAGTIGTGLFLGTGRSLAQGGPASMLICYSIVGFIVYVTLLLLGEMATQYPIAGSFNAYATRFFSPAYGFALSWNYWFNDAISVATDLTAAQLVLSFWDVPNAWTFSLVIWIFIVSVNAIHVKGYGELEYWLASLKVATIVVFILVGILVNVGVNRDHHFIGFETGNPWCAVHGGTESLGITAGETENPAKNMPRVVKFVFWRILLFYLLSLLLIGLNVPWDYPNLSNKSVTTSPFTIVFKQFGSIASASFMNTVILSSAISAGNHALFAGTRVLYGLAQASQAPSLFAWTTRRGVPLPALLLTSSFSRSAWLWLQNLVGVSNQIAWLSIGIASWRFRAAWKTQGRPLSEMKFRAGWTWPWGPPFVIISVSAIILVQGWSSVIPRFSLVDFLSFYVELLVMAIMYCLWLVFHRAFRPRATAAALLVASPSLTTESESTTRPEAQPFFDFVDASDVDLYRDEHEETRVEKHEDEVREQRLRGRVGWAWTLYYAVA